MPIVCYCGDELTSSVSLRVSECSHINEMGRSKKDAKIVFIKSSLPKLFNTVSNMDLTLSLSLSLSVCVSVSVSYHSSLTFLTVYLLQMFLIVLMLIHKCGQRNARFESYTLYLGLGRKENQVVY